MEPEFRYMVRKLAVPNLGLLSLAAYLREHLPRCEIRYVSQNLKAIIGKGPRIDEEIAGMAPDVVGISTSTANFLDGVEVARVAKLCGSTVVMGGIFPAMNDYWVLENFPEVDWIVRGEGEATFCELCATLENGRVPELVRGTTTRRNNTVVRHPPRPLLDLQMLPLPTYDLVSIQDYLDAGSEMGVFASRGCNYRCVFCTLAEFWEFRSRTFPNADVIYQLTDAKGLGFGRARLEDETFALDRKHGESLCKDIEKADVGIPLLVKTRVDIIDGELLRWLRRAGADQILVGVEDIDLTALSLIQKGSRTNWAALTQRRIRLAVDAGLSVYPVFMFGMPGETPSSVDKKVQFIMKVYEPGKVVPLLSFFTPHPGSRSWQLAQNQEMDIVTRDLRRYTHLWPVAVPKTLGADGVRVLIAAYNTVAEQTRSYEFNPPIDLDWGSKVRNGVSE